MGAYLRRGPLLVESEVNLTPPSRRSTREFPRCETLCRRFDCWPGILKMQWRGRWGRLNLVGLGIAYLLGLISIADIVVSKNVGTGPPHQRHGESGG